MFWSSPIPKHLAKLLGSGLSSDLLSTSSDVWAWSWAGLSKLLWRKRGRNWNASELGRTAVLVSNTLLEPWGGAWGVQPHMVLQVWDKVKQQQSYHAAWLTQLLVFLGLFCKVLRTLDSCLPPTGAKGRQDPWGGSHCFVVGFLNNIWKSI